MAVPPLVELARAHAQQSGFPLSSDEEVGRLLVVLAAAVRDDGSILELGTGAGVGLAWLAHGVRNRPDVSVLSVEVSPELVDLASSLPWPSNVTVRHADALDVLGEGDQYDLIFADAQGGKTEGLDLTILALAPGGILIVDDMDARPGDALHQELWESIAAAGDTLLDHPELEAVRMAWASGVIIATKVAQ
jgi:demethylmenaquinone methyltransferase/2-methoxy-6-polyprenyl-1,4-benzoquinol methylase